jgi:putative pyoverdin transport system ATP-binding/permease protein
VRRLLGFLVSRSPAVVVLTVVAAAASGAAGVLLIALVHVELSRSTPGVPGWGRAVVFLALAVFVAGARVVAQAAMARLGQGAVSELRTRLCRQVLALPLERFEALDDGRLVAVLTEDVVIVAGALVGIPLLCLNVPLVALCLAYTGWLSPLILVCGGVFAALAIAFYLALLTPAMNRLEAARAGQDRLVGHVRSLIDGFRELRQHRPRRLGFLARAIEPAAAAVRDESIAGETFFSTAIGWSELAFFGFLGFLVFVLPALHPIDRGTIAGAVLVVLYIMGPLDVILTWLPALGRAQTSLRRIDELLPALDAASGVDDPAAAVVAPPFRTSIRLDNVAYAYRPGDESERGFALGPVDLELRPGEITVLAGGNGSGKTTLVKVLTGLYPPQAGSVQVDGRPVTDDDREAYRQLFSVVFADGHLLQQLDGLERPGLDADARAGLERLGLAAKVRVADGRYSTTALSQGQRGRLALLTACLEDRPVYVFDEWAANQDLHFRRAFYREILPALRAAGKALLVISHDETFYDVADRVVRLRDGRIVDGAAPAHPLPGAAAGHCHTGDHP